MDFKSFVVILISTVLVNNYVLNQFLGVCPFLGVSKEMKSSVGMGLSVLVVMLLATVATWPIQIFILDKLNLGYLQVIVFILVIASLVQLLEMVLKKYIPSLHQSLGVYLPLITTNCAVFGLAIVNIKNNYTFGESMINALGAGIGFVLAMVIFSGIREHTQNADPPESFKGIPITLFSAAILSLAFFGFTGVSENLFG